MTQWYLLGIYLGLHPSTLDPINADYKTTKECRTQMLIEWQRRVIPTWSAVVKALVGIGRERLASELATKYSMLHLYLELTRFLLLALPSCIILQESLFQTLLLCLWRNWSMLKQTTKWLDQNACESHACNIETFIHDIISVLLHAHKGCRTRVY